MSPSENSACRQSIESERVRSEAVNLLGDFSALLQQLGTHDFRPAISPSSSLAADLPSLKTSLETYLAQVLLPLELPIIAEACGHVQRGETRELIALDQRVAGETMLAPFAAGSRQMGSIQLRRLRPLRDERTVQRYLAAVESGRAQGWHTLVYGLTLAVYAYPLRQGLLHYSRETISGLCRAAAGANPVEEILHTILAKLPEAVELTIPACEEALRGKLRSAA